MTEQPSLFGLKKTNKDFANKDSWGKNQFNSSFPAALCCYLSHKNLQANYLAIHRKKFGPGFISIRDAFGISPDCNDAYFAFEAQHSPFQKYVIGTLPRTDLVLQRETTGECLSALEVKLTALPDHTTCDLHDCDYGSELVVRPDTIVYLACSIAAVFEDQIEKYIPNLAITDWSDAVQVIPHTETIVKSIADLSLALEKRQCAFLLQPVWKTRGKSPQLATHALDVFVWSNAGFSFFISRIAHMQSISNKITRQTRTLVWLFKMLLDIHQNGKFDHEKIIDNLSYNTKNDKAFASSGRVTNPFMSCPRLEKPIILKSEIKNIILGGGQNLLSPERRFDAIIYNSPELFQS